jgi:hypothetical protein
MAQSSKDVLSTLKENQTKVDGLAAMFPDRMKQLSMKLKDVVSAVTTSQSEVHEILSGVKALQLDSQCWFTTILNL